MVINILNDLLLFSCLAAVVTGIVIAAASCSERIQQWPRTATDSLVAPAPHRRLKGKVAPARNTGARSGAVIVR